MSNLENYFSRFRKHIIGIDATFTNAFGEIKPILYADWTASGRNYDLIEQKLSREIMPFVANTHTETSSTGEAMTFAYHEAQQIIKKHVNAGKEDVIISSNSGMTGVVNKFQRILGLRVHEKFRNLVEVPANEQPVVFITHMEHHSNQTSWLETIAEVVIVPPSEDGLVSPECFKLEVEKYKDRSLKIASISACSNVTGIETPYHAIAEIMHAYNGLCFVDFACSAPYVEINMHPANAAQSLDAIFFSPHKFLGGPGTTGILIFNSSLYHNQVPDHTGGGTVDWTNPWGQHKYIDDIEAREDGGTPAFLQTIKAAMCVKLKEEMGVENIRAREEELMAILFAKLSGVENLHILAEKHQHRLGVFSFYIDGLHYNLGVKLLNDKFGIQTRGGCSCAGTYGHYLLNVNAEVSSQITCKISQGDLTDKPGWIRASIHPTLTNAEVTFLADCILDVAKNYTQYLERYEFNPARGHISVKNKSEPKESVKELMRTALYGAWS